MTERLMTPEQAADYLAVAPKTMRDWLRTGRIRGVKVGRLWRVRLSDLEAFIEEPTIEGKEEES